jgi:hypothetical protein
MGYILLAATGALGYFSISMKGVGMIPTTLVMGLAHAVFGEKSSNFLGSRANHLLVVGCLYLFCSLLAWLPIIGSKKY